MDEKQSFSHVCEVDINNLVPRLHNDCWVVNDSRSNRLTQGGAIFSEENAMKMAEELNKMVHRSTFGDTFGFMVQVRGPFYAYRLKTAKDLGLLKKAA